MNICNQKFEAHRHEVENLRAEAAKNVLDEPTGGLSITKAIYGNFQATEEEREKYHLVIDVTIPLQAMITNRSPLCGKVKLPVTSKRTLKGYELHVR